MSTPLGSGFSPHSDDCDCHQCRIAELEHQREVWKERAISERDKNKDLEQQLKIAHGSLLRTTTLLKQADKFGVSNAWWREVKEALKEQDK